MNNHDKNNLNFLLSVDICTLYDWYEKVDEDDHLYAIELLTKFNLENIDINKNGLDEKDLDNLKFLLNIDNKTLYDWYEKVNEEDHLYAIELLTAFKQEKINYEIEQVLSLMKDFTEVKKILNKF